MRIFSPAFMFLVPFSLLAEEECVFDQKEQEQTYLELQKKYPGSRYIENEHRLLIPENGQQITLRRGGCVHFGITIEVQAPLLAGSDSENVAILASLRLDKRVDSREVQDYFRKSCRELGIIWPGRTAG